MKTLSFLHTAPSNADLFEELTSHSPVTREHVLRDDLLNRAIEAGHLTSDLQEETQTVLAKMAETAFVYQSGR